MIDTHTHLYEEAFAPDGGGEAAVDRALEAGIRHLVFPNVDSTTIAPLLALKELRPEVVSAAMGLHPTSVNENRRDELDRVEKYLARGGFVAVGEVGMDLYWDSTFREAQREVFDTQIGWAAASGLPVIIHCREALDDTLDILRGRRGNLPPLVFHSFTLGPDEVARIRSVADAWFGINGVVTYKNAASLREAIPVIGASRLLLETDSPYLAPVPRRGRRNESSLLGYVRDAVAQAAGLSPEEIETTTDRNAIGLFRLPVADSPVGATP